MQYFQHISICGNIAAFYCRYIESESLYCLTSLKLLHLQQNALVFLESAVFTRLSKLREIQLSLNRLISICPSLFSRLSNLRVLYLAANKLVDLTFLKFSNHTNLCELDLKYNNKIQIGIATFQGLDSLETLMICQIPVKGFQFLPKLDILDMNTCNMWSVTPWFIQYLPNVHKVMLNKNHLTHIPDYAFATSALLEYIDLMCNQISMVNSLALFRLSSLKKIHMEHNYLHSIDILNISGPTLQKLDLHNNQVCNPL